MKLDPSVFEEAARRVGEADGSYSPGSWEDCDHHVCCALKKIVGEHEAAPYIEHFSILYRGSQWYDSMYSPENQWFRVNACLQAAKSLKK